MTPLDNIIADLNRGTRGERAAARMVIRWIKDLLEDHQKEFQYLLDSSVRTLGYYELTEDEVDHLVLQVNGLLESLEDAEEGID